MNILIVDDHDIVRQSLGMIIQSEFPKASVTKTENAEQVIEALKKEKFDLIILDMNLPDMDGVSLTEWVLDHYPAQMILIFSMNPAGLFAKKLYQMGVMGYLNKQADMTEIRTALRTILREKKQYRSHEFKSMLAQGEIKGPVKDPVEQLSKRELSIAQYLARGKSFDEIAQLLHIEPSTIRTYKARIFQKFEVSSLYEFLSKARLYKID